MIELRGSGAICAIGKYSMCDTCVSADVGFNRRVRCGTSAPFPYIQ